MKFSFMRMPKPRQFEYRPRHYDPVEEERLARKRELLGEDYTGEAVDGDYKPGQYIRQLRIRRGIIADREKKQKRQRRSLRSIVMLVLLAAFAWWLMTADFSHSVWAVFFGGGAQ